MIVDSVMLDHLSWLSIDTGTAYRAVRSGDSVWALTCAPCDTGGHETAARLVSGAGDPPVMDVIDPTTLNRGQSRDRAPALGADLIFARFLLAHLPDIAGTTSGWLSQLHPLGVLILEETEVIETANPVFRDYLALAEQLVASRGGTIYAGSALARLAASSRTRVTANEVRRVPVAASRAAEMFALNFSVWRSDSAVGQPPDTLDNLAARLDRLRETGGSEYITWTIRQLALSPVEWAATFERDEVASP